MVSVLEPQVQPLSIPDATPAFPTADDIIAAFRKHGLTPKPFMLFQDWPHAEGKPASACALGAIIYDWAPLDVRNGILLNSAFLDLATDWQWGVADGFNGSTQYQCFTNAALYAEGLATGRAVHRWAFGQ